MKQFETIERCGRLHVVKNGVESAEFAIPSLDGHVVYLPEYLLERKTREAALAFIAASMDTWYTVAEAAVRLVELDKADKPPAIQTMYRWLRAGRFPRAIKVGKVGRGGSWRLPETALWEFTRKGGEKQ